MNLKLVDATMDEFKNKIYPEYIKLFPREERKEQVDIEKAIRCKITKVIKLIINENEFVGFFIMNVIENIPYIQLDYFAILSKYQSKGYGSQAIKLLKDKYKDYKGIFIEIEKPGLGKNKDENKIREKRAKFYEKLGFYQLNFEIKLYNVVYSTYILSDQKEKNSEEIVMENVLKIYNAILGTKRVEENFQFVI